MRRTDMMRLRSMSLGLVALFALACTDSPTAPMMSPVSDAPLFALSNKPILDQTLEGEAWVCKDGTGAATNFSFSVSVNGGAATSHNIALGTCALVHTVPTNQGQFFATVSVTENVPSGWTLNTIVVESNNPNTSLFQPVINKPNASGRMSHDWGIVITFTNTQNPPSFCTRTQGFWKTHGDLWDAAGDNKPFLTSNLFYNSGVSYLTIMWTPPSGGNAYLQLAHQYIAAVLNAGGGASGVASVDAAIAGAAAYFGSAPAGIPNPTGSLRTQLQGWATTLDNFNKGSIGPGHCGS